MRLGFFTHNANTWIPLFPSVFIPDFTKIPSLQRGRGGDGLRFSNEHTKPALTLSLRERG
jgi:hypothetical protein